MSVIEDTRKLLQDFLAPELRELSARVDALEERMNARFDAAEKTMDARFKELDTRFKGIDARVDSAERLGSERHAQTIQAIGRLADMYALSERVARI